MNRAERRRIEKAKAKTHVVSRSEALAAAAYQRGLEEGKRLGSGIAVRTMTTSAAAILNHEFGFGKIRLDRFLNQMYYTLLTIRNDNSREKRMREWVNGRTGLDLDDYTGARCLDARNEIEKMARLGTWIYPENLEGLTGPGENGG